MRYPFHIIALFVLLLIVACGDSGTAFVADDVDRHVATMDDLLNCTANLEGETYLVTEQKNTYICVDGEWLDFVPTMDDLLNCTMNRESKTVYVNEHNSAYVCMDEKWYPQRDVLDSRDGQIYKTVTIGTQTWMAENLNYETANSYCFGGTPANCTKYGRLYMWAAAVGKSESECGEGKTCSLPSGNIQGACPSGWHLPSLAEFETLFTAVGGPSTAGKVLKSTSGWNSSGNGSDAFAFSALPAGDRVNYGDYKYEGNIAFFWSSTENNSYSAYTMYLYYNDDDAYLDYDGKDFGFSVRCVKD